MSSSAVQACDICDRSMLIRKQKQVLKKTNLDAKNLELRFPDNLGLLLSLQCSWNSVSRRINLWSSKLP